MLAASVKLRGIAVSDKWDKSPEDYTDQQPDDFCKTTDVNADAGGSMGTGGVYRNFPPSYSTWEPDRWAELKNIGYIVLGILLLISVLFFFERITGIPLKTSYMFDRESIENRESP